MDGCNNCDTDDYIDGDRIVHDYSFRPDPIFYSSSPEERLYFGIEIEVEAKGGDYEIRRNGAQRAHKLEDSQLAYLKNDGSLNCGFEIVTHPMSHDYYMNEADELWDTLEDLRTNHDIKSWDTRTCGLHIHISRTGFNGGAHMHRFLNLVYSNKALYELLAGRSSSQWSKFDDVDRPVPTGGLNEEGFREWKTIRSYKDKIQQGRNTDRYSAVNTQNRATLEMRIFRGTINSGKVKSQINLAHASVEYTRTLTVKNVRDGALQASQFVQYIMAHADIYPELATRLEKQYLQVTVG
jgi:L-rhamnose mutarotase